MFVTESNLGLIHFMLRAHQIMNVKKYNTLLT